jgi:putative solute:sodium symporter small subunit
MSGIRTSKAESNPSDSISEAQFKAYWKANLLLMAALLTIWALVSFGAAILFRDTLDQFSIGGAPLGFWMAQQGSIYVFVVLIFVYSVLMHRIERKYGIDDDQS